jgi:hypothetical protein
MTAHDFPELDGMPPKEAVHNHMVDISAYAQFNWYNKYVWYIDQSEDVTEKGSLVIGSVSQKIKALR